MKIKIELDDNLTEDEVIIKCSKLDNDIQKLQQTISNVIRTKQTLSFFKENKEFYLSLDEILFFETYHNTVSAHTVDNIFQVKYRLYELETLLPSNFIRISKSTILNLNHIFSVTHNIASSSLVEFCKSHKQVYVSRHYYRYLCMRLNERRSFK